MHTVNVPMDFLAANAVIAALEQRTRTLRGHVENGVNDPVLDAAILHTLRAEDAVRKAFRLQTDAQQQAEFEALHADLEDFRVIEDIPLALLSYMGEGR